jgi:hypothetical protein
MRTRVALMACVGAALMAEAAAAQQRVTVDVRADVAMPVEKFAGAELGTGVGFGGTLAVRIQRHLHVYGGWDWLHFNPEASFAGVDMDFEETGYTFGLRFDHPIRGQTGLTLRIDAGGTYKHLEIEGNDGEGLLDSEHKPGFELGIGFTIPIGGSWRVASGARFRSLKPEFDIDQGTTKATLRYVGFELGVTKRF